MMNGILRVNKVLWEKSILQNLKEKNPELHTYCTDNQITEIKIPVPWGQISGKWWGKLNVTPIIGLHGWQDNAGTFDGVAPLLPKNVSLLALDLPGHGLSSWYPSSTYYRFSQGLHVIRRIVKQFKWDKISILGHSMGSAYGFFYASVFPDEVEKFIGLDLARPMASCPNVLVSNANEIIDNCLQKNEMNLASSPKFTHDELVERMLNGYRGSLTRDSCEILLRRGMVKSPCGNYCFSRDPRLNASTNDLNSLPHSLLMNLAANIKCEVLNIKMNPGEDPDNVTFYYETLDIMKRSAKRLEFHEIEGSHHQHLNYPLVTASIISQFLNS